MRNYAEARDELCKGVLPEPGMVFMIEPGLRLHTNSLPTPEGYHGTGVHIEGDVIVDVDGTTTRVSESIPRTVVDIEEWIVRIQPHRNASAELRLGPDLVLFGKRGYGVLMCGHRALGAVRYGGRGVGRVHKDIGPGGRGLGRPAATGHLPVLGRHTKAGASVGREIDGILLQARLSHTQAYDARVVAGGAL